MHATRAATRPKESLFGICAAIGEDFGFNPDILRVALAAALLWNPVIVLGSYFSAGLVVLASRRLFPRATPVARCAAPPVVRSGEAVAPAPEPIRSEERVPLAHAA